jgi:hypothetical protein
LTPPWKDYDEVFTLVIEMTIGTDNQNAIPVDTNGRIFEFQLT